MSLPDGRPLVTMPNMCDEHRTDFHRNHMRLGPSGPWMAAETVAMLLLFQGATADERIWKRAEGEAGNLSLILNELGCLACWDPLLYGRMVRVMKKGFSHACRVSKGEVVDEGFDLRAHKPKPPS